MEIPRGGAGVELAMGVPCSPAIYGRRQRAPVPPPSIRNGTPESRQGSRYSRRDRKTSLLPHLSAFFCDPSARKRVRYSDHPGTPGAQGCEHHHDLYPCPQPRREGGPKPCGYGILSRSHPPSPSIPFALSRPPKPPIAPPPQRHPPLTTQNQKAFQYSDALSPLDTALPNCRLSLIQTLSMQFRRISVGQTINRRIR